MDPRPEEQQDSRQQGWSIRHSFLWRLFLGYALLVALVAVIFALVVTPGLRSAYESDTEATLASQATLLAEIARPVLTSLPQEHRQGTAALADPRSSGLQDRVRELGLEVGGRFTIILPDGTVIADTSGEPSQMSNHSQRPELRAAQIDGYGQSIRYSRTVGYRLMYVARPVMSQGELVGLVRASLPLDRMDARILELVRRVLLSAAIALVVALVLGWIVGRRITQPLRQLTAAVQHMGSGGPLHRIVVDSDDEIGSLARTINRMGDALESRITEVHGDRNKILAVLAAMNEGVIAVDSDEQILHINDAALKMLDLDMEIARGAHVWEAVRVSGICSLISTVTGGEKEARSAVHISTASGDRELELHCTRLLDAAGKPGGAVLVVRDVTELRRLERVRTEFVSNVSHELKTPLTAISGLVESILGDPEMPEAVRQSFLARVHGQARRLNDLVQDLLSLSRAERPGLRVERQAMDLKTALRESIHSIEPLVEEKAIELEVELGDQPLVVDADTESLRQIFDNLLSNASRYTAARGTIRVTARQDHHRVVVEIQDNGIGIEPAQQARVFERFYRVDSARSRELGGTGLGLAIVKHVTQSLGGDIELESEPGVGSNFRVGFPVSGTDPKSA